MSGIPGASSEGAPPAGVNPATQQSTPDEQALRSIGLQSEENCSGVKISPRGSRLPVEYLDSQMADTPLDASPLTFCRAKRPSGAQESDSVKRIRRAEDTVLGSDLEEVTPQRIPRRMAVIGVSTDDDRQSCPRGCGRAEKVARTLGRGW